MIYCHLFSIYRAKLPVVFTALARCASPLRALIDDGPVQPSTSHRTQNPCSDHIAGPTCSVRDTMKDTQFVTLDSGRRLAYWVIPVAGPSRIQRLLLRLFGPQLPRHSRDVEGRNLPFPYNYGFFKNVFISENIVRVKRLGLFGNDSQLKALHCGTGTIRGLPSPTRHPSSFNSHSAEKRKRS